MKYIQQIFNKKKKIRFSRDQFVMAQLYDEQTITETGYILKHDYFFKYKGKKYKAVMNKDYTWERKYIR